MSHRSELAPSTLPVDLTAGGITVEYLDGREVFYHGVPRTVAGSVRAPPGKNVHVLVTDAGGTEGAMFYVNDRRTHDDILEDSGVGRALVPEDERSQLFPGVEVERDGYAHVVDADLSVVEGRVFVFVEDEFEEASYEVVAPDAVDEDGTSEDDGDARDGGGGATADDGDTRDGGATADDGDARDGDGEATADDGSTEADG
jgi:hypothetical protein